METNLTFTGFIANLSDLQEADATNGGKYFFLNLELRTDEAFPQSVMLFISGPLAVQLSSCHITPQTLIRAYLRLNAREYTATDNTLRKSNEVSCWKLDIIDPESQEIFTARKY